MCTKYSLVATRTGRVFDGFGVVHSHSLIAALHGLDEDRCNTYECEPLCAQDTADDYVLAFEDWDFHLDELAYDVPKDENAALYDALRRRVVTYGDWKRTMPDIEGFWAAYLDRFKCKSLDWLDCFYEDTATLFALIDAQFSSEELLQQYSTIVSATGHACSLDLHDQLLQRFDALPDAREAVLAVFGSLFWYIDCVPWSTMVVKRYQFTADELQRVITAKDWRWYNTNVLHYSSCHAELTEYLTSRMTFEEKEHVQ